MAGYVINLDSEESLMRYFKYGVYSTKLSTPRGYFTTPQEGTFADYASMKKNDLVFFFIKRKIYGIGKLIEVYGDVKCLNYPQANIPESIDYNVIRNTLLLDEGDKSVNQRWICFFEPYPFFFKKGIDMDDVLLSNENCFRILRAFWKVSFIKLDDIEAKCLFDVILKQNYQKDTKNTFDTSCQNFHTQIKNKLNDEYKFRADEILEYASNEDKIKHEMAIEAGLIYQLSYKDEDTTRVFGNFDYISHQVVASPFKPIDYMDKMDIYGYNYIENFKTIDKHKIIEIKKDTAGIEEVNQLLKYVDFVKDEIANRNYDNISAYLVAYDFKDEAKEYLKTISRKFVIGTKPVISREWNDINLVKYKYDKINKKLLFELV